jgi:hypothetical protein
VRVLGRLRLPQLAQITRVFLTGPAIIFSPEVLGVAAKMGKFPIRDLIELYFCGHQRPPLDTSTNHDH